MHVFLLLSEHITTIYSFDKENRLCDENIY
jgi:hypothetical protein